MREAVLFLAVALVAACGVALVAACGDDGSSARDAGSDADVGIDGATDASFDAAADARVDAPSDAGADAEDGAADAASDAADAATPSRIDELLGVLEDPAASAADLDAALERAGTEARLPLVEGERLLFVTRWDEAPAGVALVSDLNEWDSTANVASVAASGVHFYVLFDLSTAAAPVVGALYKWWGTPDVFRAPPEATAYGFDDFGEHGIVAPDYAVQHRQRFPLRSLHLDVPRMIRFLLPAGFSPGTPAAADARVLFMHDGQNLFHPDAIWGGWRVDEAVAPGSAFDDVVVVGVDNAEDRFDAYTHVPDDIGGGARIGGRADDYLSLVSMEALPFARQKFGLGATQARTVIAGSSLGGLVTLVGAIEVPTLAGCVIAMSPTLGWGAFDPALDGSDALVNRWADEVGHGGVAIYLDSGGAVTGACVDTDADGVQEDSDDRDSYCTTSQLRDELNGLGYTFGADLFHFHEPGAGHNEAEWAARLPGALSACATAGW